MFRIGVRAWAAGLSTGALLVLGAPAAGAQGFTPSQVNCHVAGAAPNVNLDCPGEIFPIGEPGIAVDPKDPNHVVVTAMNEFECCPLFATTFDGGANWVSGTLSAPPTPSGQSLSHADLSVAFDPKHRTVVALHIVLHMRGQGASQETGDADIAATVSTDGGITWDEPTIVARGKGFGERQRFNDKPWLTVDDNPGSPYYGRLYATWDRLEESGLDFAKVTEYGKTIESHSDDGGLTWTKPQVISGRNRRFCTFTGLGSKRGSCDQGLSTSGVVDRDGLVTIAFLNPQNKRGWDRGDKLEDQYMVMQSADGGRTWSNPRHVVQLQDGVRDLPIDPDDGASTLSGYKLPFGAFGNLALDRSRGRYRSSGKYYLVFSDNRAGKHDVADPKSDLGVYMMTSRNGQNWRGPVTVSNAASDQWQPFAAVNPVTRRVGVVFLDRHYGSRRFYNLTYAERRRDGRFTRTRISTEDSHPKESLWFRDSENPIGPGQPPCSKCAQWNGDYIALEYGSDGRAHMAWSDMRVFVPDPFIGPGPGFTLDPFYASRR